MTTADLTHHRQPQARRLSRFGVTASVDMHCHCLPGIDDGPATLDEAVKLCLALVNDGMTDVIATPHQLGPYEHVRARDVHAAADLLRAELATLAVPLRLHVGAEIRIDDRLLDLLAAGELLTLADARAYVLIELPHSTLVDLRGLIETLVVGGITPIVSHPERHAQLARTPDLLAPWLARGAVLQVTSGSLTGDFGPGALQASRTLMERGWVSLIASDTHNAVARRPAMTEAIEEVVRLGGHALARRLCLQNPQAVLEGRPIVKPRVVGRPTRGRR